MILIVRPIDRSLDPLPVWIEIGDQLEGGKIIECDYIAARGNENVDRTGYGAQWLLKEKGNFEQIAKVADDQVEEVQGDIDVRNPRVVFVSTRRHRFVAHRASNRGCEFDFGIVEEINLLDVSTRMYELGSVVEMRSKTRRRAFGWKNYNGEGEDVFVKSLCTNVETTFTHQNMR